MGMIGMVGRGYFLFIGLLLLLQGTGWTVGITLKLKQGVRECVTKNVGDSYSAIDLVEDGDGRHADHAGVVVRGSYVVSSPMQLRDYQSVGDRRRAGMKNVWAQMRRFKDRAAVDVEVFRPDGALLHSRLDSEDGLFSVVVDRVRGADGMEAFNWLGPYKVCFSVALPENEVFVADRHNLKKKGDAANEAGGERDPNRGWVSLDIQEVSVTPFHDSAELILTDSGQEEMIQPGKNTNQGFGGRGVLLPYTVNGDYVHALDRESLQEFQQTLWRINYQIASIQTEVNFREKYNARTLAQMKEKMGTAVQQELVQVFVIITIALLQVVVTTIYLRKKLAADRKKSKV